MNSDKLTPRDIETLAQARAIPCTRWYDILDLTPETEECKQELRNIRIEKFHEEEGNSI